jgi:shikimate kinase
MTTFRDADAEVEKAAAMSIAEIFEQHGEAGLSRWRTPRHQAAA